MNSFLDKLSSYNIFNNLLPGIVFVVIAEALTSFSFIQQEIVIGLFFYYFIGLVISRIGSVLIEPFLRKVNFVKFEDYSNFIAASKKDIKIEVLSETNNTYRTLCSLFLLLLVIKLYEQITIALPSVDKWNIVVITTGLMLLFGFSYRKQTKYIIKRIEVALKKGD